MRLRRDQIRRIVGDDPQAIKAFEDLFAAFGDNRSGIETGRVDFIPSTQQRKTGRVWFDENDETLSVGMAGGESVLQVGMEEYFPRVENITGDLIPNGTLLGFSGVTGTIDVSPFIADGSIDPAFIVGFATEDIENTKLGYCSKFGYVRNINTTGADVGEVWVKGDILYASPVTPGKLTRTKPIPPAIVIPCAAVVEVGATNGKLLVRVAPQQRLYYGAFFDTTNQTTIANTPTPVLLNSTHVASGTYRGSPTSRIYVQNTGLYEFQFSIQFVSATASLETIYIWFRLNGVDQPNSASRITIANNNTTIVPAWNFQQEMVAGDYFELVWATSSANVSMAAYPAQTVPFNMPSTPSVLLTVAQINQ